MHARAQPGWMIVRSIWWRHRLGFGALLALALVGAGGLPVLAAHVSNQDVVDGLGNLSMGLSLFLTFAFCSFTESDRRGRLEGYPSRLYTLPVRTRTLVGAPMLFGVAAVVAIYGIWSQGVLARTGRELPWLWPSGYLAAGMLCHQSLVWALARHRVARLLALGIGGALLASCWIVFREEFARDVLGSASLAGLPARRAYGLLLALVAAGALGVAYWAVEFERRGRGRERRGWRGWLERALDALPRRRQRFSTPAAAQLWWEWRRHGLAFAALTTLVLLVIMVPALFVGPLAAPRMVLCVVFILSTPFLLALALGNGFGKTDLWSRVSNGPVFLATRPLPMADRIAAKMKAAALAVLAAWTILGVLTAGWLRWGGDGRIVTQMLQRAASFHPTLGVGGMLAILAAGAVLLTWRLLAGSLYLGMLRRDWLVALAVAGVFVAVFVGIFVVALLSDRPDALEHFMRPAVAWSRTLALLFAVKIAGAGGLGAAACRRGWIASGTVWRYFGIWCCLTGGMVGLVWMAVPAEAAWRGIMLWSALLTVPLLRVSAAPWTLALARRR